MEQEIFEEIIEFPNSDAQKSFAALVGLDGTKDRLLNEARLMFNPHLLDEWSNKHHGRVLPLAELIRNRSSLFVFAGDVGAGKTALAESFADPIARQEGIAIRLYRLSLTARGIGAVGQMTTLLTNAFQKVREAAKKGSSAGKKPSSAIVFLIDEADALAQSREADQMHHEDRAGVNALIRGIDSLMGAGLPVLVVMCTNRIGALDPAIKRRAAEVFEFGRPNQEQCAYILGKYLADTGITESQIGKLATMISREASGHGCTFSDIVQRLLPNILFDAVPDRPISFEVAEKIVKSFVPTPPFKELVRLDD